MTYTTLLVHLELGRPNTGLLQIATDLAARFDAVAIGIAVCQPMQLLVGAGCVSADVIELDREEIKKEIRGAEAAFRSALRGHVKSLEWRSAVTFASLSDYWQGRRVAPTYSSRVRISEVPWSTVQRRVNLGDLVMRVGRPVLVVPAAADNVKLERVIIGWKETREARRAAFDALPLLKKAAEMFVVEIAAEEERAAAHTHLEDVAAWLKRHGIDAECLVSSLAGDGASQLDTIAHERNADLIVAGAYGHSRLREWVLGGVTRDLLLRAGRCSLVSH